jgi:multidrug efflux pump subunit AcrA (membrane-fusion protein)
MTKDELAAIKARIANASKPPWQYNETLGRFENGDRKSIIRIHRAQKGSIIEANPADQIFITSAREDVPCLIAEVEKLENLLSELRNLIARSDLIAPISQLQNALAEKRAQALRLEQRKIELEQEHQALLSNYESFSKRLIKKTNAINLREKVMQAAREFLREGGKEREYLLEQSIAKLDKFLSDREDEKLA